MLSQQLKDNKDTKVAMSTLILHILVSILSDYRNIGFLEKQLIIRLAENKRKMSISCVNVPEIICAKKISEGLGGANMDQI